MNNNLLINYWHSLKILRRNLQNRQSFIYKAYRLVTTNINRWLARGVILNLKMGLRIWHLDEVTSILRWSNVVILLFQCCPYVGHTLVPTSPQPCIVLCVKWEYNSVSTLCQCNIVRWKYAEMSHSQYSLAFSQMCRNIIFLRFCKAYVSLL